MMEEPYELPEGWVWTRLESCVDILDAQRIPINSEEREKRKGDSPYYGATGQIGWIDDYIFDEELLLLGEDGAPFFEKKKNVAYIITGKSWVNNHAHVLRAIKKLTSNRFLGHYLNSFDYHGYVKGTTRLKLNQAALRTIPIPLSPLNEQHLVVAKLEALLSQVNASKEHLAKVPTLIKQFRQSVLAAACSGRLTEDWRREHPDVEPASELLKRIREERMRRYEEECQKAKAEGRRKPTKPKNLEPQEVEAMGLPELPEGWVWCKLGDILNDFQPGFACGARDDRGYVQLRMNNIGLDGKVVLGKTLKVPIERTNLEMYNLRWGDLLFNNTNSVELIGKTALFRDEVQNCVFSNHITRIRPDVRLVNSEFLLNLFIDDYNKGVFRMMCHRFVGQAGISREKLLEHILPLPPLLEQHAVVERVEDLFKFADEVEQRVAAATTYANQLIKTIRAKAFRGELVPQDSNDEPASVLLERIKKERAEQKEMKKAQKRKSKTLLDFN